MLAWGDTADVFSLPKIHCSIESPDANGFERRKTSLNQQLVLSLIAKSYNDMAVPSWVRSRQELSSRFHKGHFHRKLSLEESAMKVLEGRPALG